MRWCVILGVSRAMRLSGRFVYVKRMAIALQVLAFFQCPVEFIRFIETYTLQNFDCRLKYSKLFQSPLRSAIPAFEKDCRYGPRRRKRRRCSSPFYEYSTTIRRSGESVHQSKPLINRLTWQQTACRQHILWIIGRICFIEHICKPKRRLFVRESCAEKTK